MKRVNLPEVSCSDLPSKKKYNSFPEKLMARSQDQFFLPAIPNASGSRVNSLEDRMSNQERTTAVLLDQAFRIKDGIVSYLQGNKGFQQGEAVALQLLENHIQTITSIVKKLSHDIEMLERQIKTRDDVTSGTNFAVQSMDHKHLQGVGDLRGRVARCDASIAKLSGDTNIIRYEIQKQEREIHAIQSTLENYTNNIEMKEAVEKKTEDGFHYLSKRIENSDKTVRFETDLSHVKNDQSKLHARIIRFEKTMWNELEEIQSEYRAGFQSIRDSFDALKQIQTTKLKLEKEKFKQDMKKIRRKITALQED
ncbi:protein FAM81B isoform X4 [Sphaerodactylus townsendi]|uniref:protein FAM81B isoform X4 n=1 Tax=Sphaerodactylus townsendi TaxID=933632 RepID=UPI002026DCB8|nr:protein FAM81B isoform X4 [Sphaerodactylus townsendi]